MKKSLTLVMAMALGITASAYAANPFSDVPAGHWAYDSVAKLATAGVVDGYADGSFDGEKLMTRYEMAQIVAKAMAKGASVDKLAAEFADELDTLGVRVAKLESKADAVKITGEVRYHYMDIDGDIYGFENRLRTRLWVQGAINDDWTYTGMLQNTQKFEDDDGEESTYFKRAYVEGKIGGVNVLAGRYNAYLVNGNLYDEHADGIELSYGKDVKFTAFYMKPTDQYPPYSVGIDVNDVIYYDCVWYDKAYGAKLETQIGIVDANVGYTVFKDGIAEREWEDVGETIDGLGDQKDNKIWNIGIKTDIAKDVVLTADYLKSDVKKMYNNGAESINFGDDDGFVVGVDYKGAKASEAGSYGIYAKYYDQARGTYIAHTMNGVYPEYGFKGYMIGANYTLAKNIVAALEWYDLNGDNVKGSNDIYCDEDVETLWAQVVFTF